MKTKTWIYLLVSVIAFCLISSCSEKGTEPPNILLIMADDMGYSDIGCYGSEIPTPNLDQLAEDGIRFSQFYNTARCCPTRASLLTGLHPHQTGMGAMESDGGEDGYRGDINRHCVTIAEVLKTAGYKTYMSGKWHITRFKNADGPKHNWPLQRGFDRFYGTITGAGSYYDPASLCRGNEFITPENDTKYQPELFYYTNAITDNAISYISDHYSEFSENPYFMYIAYTAAHWPMHALPEDIEPFEGWYDEGYDAIRKLRIEKMKQLGVIPPNTELSPAPWKWEERTDKEWEADMMEVYAAMIACLDRGIGRIVNEIKKNNDLENTLIMYLQDNGGCAENWLNWVNNAIYDTMSILPMDRDELQTRIWPPMQTRDGRPIIVGPTMKPGGPESYPLYDMGWANVSNTPFRRYKHFIQEGGISTPLIVHWPDMINESGTIVDQTGQLMDIMTTCVEVSGAEYPSVYNDINVYPLEGLSLLPVFQGEELGIRSLYWEHIGKCGVRNGDWKLVAIGHGRKDPIPLEKWELYNIAEDRAENYNLAKEMPDLVKQLADEWHIWARRAKVIPYPH